MPLPKHCSIPHAALLLLAISGMLVAGCGGSGRDARGDGGPARVEQDEGTAGAPRRVIATLGDSIVAGSPLWDPDAEARSRFPEVDEDSQWQRSVEASRDAQLRNCGVWGERTDEIAERFDRCTRGADAVVIQGGINDIVQGRDIDDAAAQLACMVELAREAGLDAALVEVLPWNNGFPQAATPIRRLNDEIGELARAAGIPILPFYRVLDDREQPGRMPRELTDDGNHPDIEGYRRLGTQAWREPEPVTGSVAKRCAAAR